MPKQIRNIVLGVAEIAAPDPHLAAAVELAGALGARLHVVHAYPLPGPMLHPVPPPAGFTLEAVQQLHGLTQSRLEASMRKASGGSPHRCRALPGPADLAILDIGEEVGADLVIVGATRHGALARSLLGTTAQRVLRASTIPVLVSRDRDFRPTRRILLTTDLSELSANVHERGIGLLSVLRQERDLELRSLMVADDDDLLDGDPASGVRGKGAEGRLEAFLARHYAGMMAEGVLRTGEPAREIIAEAVDWNADLLVLGTHGRTGASRLLIGSVAESVLKSAPCDVLMIPRKRPLARQEMIPTRAATATGAEIPAALEVSGV